MRGLRIHCIFVRFNITDHGFLGVVTHASLALTQQFPNSFFDCRLKGDLKCGAPGCSIV
jgi:hypothetical protein